MPANGVARRAFLTHSARARAAVGPILSETEALLQELGWRTRLPLRPDPGSVTTEERRRLREESYAQVESSDLVLHVPSPASLAGTQLNRELNHAVRAGKSVGLLLCLDLRDAHGIGLPHEDRLAELLGLTQGPLIERFSGLAAVLGSWPDGSSGG
jgi:hypothetical protein